MNDFPVSVRTIGAGSQPRDDDELQYLAMPRGMNTFRMPMVPERAEASALAAHAISSRHFCRGRSVGSGRRATGPAARSWRHRAAGLDVTNQMLGEGEVSIRIDGARGFRIQESVFTGLWRVCALDADGRLARDWLEAGILPEVAIDIARDVGTSCSARIDVPPGAMNSPALLAEIASQMATRTRGDGAHVINLTLFPMTPEDHAVLEQALPVGPVAMISRGFGNCHVTSTGLADVWRVQYFNNMNTLILNTIEVVDVPEVVLAAVEDLTDTRDRLADLVGWMTESCAERTTS